MTNEQFDILIKKCEPLIVFLAIFVALICCILICYLVRYIDSWDKEDKNKCYCEFYRNDVVSRALYDYKVDEYKRLEDSFNKIYDENDKYLEEFAQIYNAWYHFRKSYFDYRDHKIGFDDLDYLFYYVDDVIGPVTGPEDFED